MLNYKKKVGTQYQIRNQKKIDSLRIDFLM